MSVKKLIGSVQIKLLTLGDTRYDQVIERARSRITNHIPRLFDEDFVFIIGSIWPQDAKHLLPAVVEIFKKFDHFRCIIAPHEPNEYALESFEDYFKGEGISYLRFSRTQKRPVGERIVLIDKVGILAELYHQANLAFIGGGFRGSIHNVMEPAVAGLPVLFGPDYYNSREAELLIEAGGGFSCDTGKCLLKHIKTFIKDQKAYEEASYSARKVIWDNMGASARTVKEILEND